MKPGQITTLGRIRVYPSIEPQHRRENAKCVHVNDDPRSMARCNLNHLVSCPSHTPVQYAWFARHRKGRHE